MTQSLRVFLKERPSVAEVRKLLKLPRASRQRDAWCIVIIWDALSVGDLRHCRYVILHDTDQDQRDDSDARSVGQQNVAMSSGSHLRH